jgi:uridylate kinase
MPDAAPAPYRRVLLKISGECFCPPGGFGIGSAELTFIGHEIASAREVVPELAVVIGGGNIVRGAALAERGQIDQSTADYMGMLGTVINGMALREILTGSGVEARLMSAIDIPAVAEPFIQGRAERHLEKGRILILAAGTGQPFFTTDTCASLRAVQLSAEVLLKATKVDGVYDADPLTTPDATRFERLGYEEAIARQLGVMDLTALTMCLEKRMPIRVFDYKQPGNIRRVAGGEALGTLVGP